MTDLPLPAVLVLLLAWGVVVGVDLVSVLQGLLARPLVAGAGAGWILGDAEAGLRVGAVLELFALDVLPVGASRYPEYGPATVGGVVAASGVPWQEGTGVGVAVGLAVALLGGASLDWLRHANARHLHRLAHEVDAGSPAAIRRLQWAGIGRDAARAALVTLVGLSLGAAAATLQQSTVAPALRLLTPVLVGAGIASALSGAQRMAGRGRRLAWLGVGLGLGIVTVLARGA